MSQEQTIPLSECTLEQYRARPKYHPKPPSLLNLTYLPDEKPGIEEHANIIFLGAVCVIGAICWFHANE